MSDYQSKFQQLLRELFQFDSADLDFGIYRIMNHKREVIERFITEDLPQAIAEELERGALAEQSRATQALEAARKKVLDALGDDALDAEGNLAEKYSGTRAGREYLAAQAEAAGARDRQALEVAIYNHLYTFFSRYYQDGDFISKRRYSKRERYAIPYNGEEVTLYWANHDQYYIKTAEHFTDYTYKAPNGVTVHFKLQAADVEQDNVKGEKRFFLPCLDGIAWDEAASEVVIPFEYRPLTQQEAIAYGKRQQQDEIIAKALETIPRRLAKSPRALAALTAERRKTADGDPVSYLEHHLRQYTRRNTSDFFIHKDLRGFLSRELDFYLKNEVLNLEEMEAAGEGLAGGWFQMLRLIKAIGNRIIAFLAQIENFQKMLWEKRKFITETFYCITLGQIDEAFYPEIAANEMQWEEWRALCGLDAPATPAGCLAFLKTHPTLVLDTRHFSPDPSTSSGQGFVDRLLASFDDPSMGSGQGLDEMTDGLLVHSENWQALNMLAERYKEKIDGVYIDPPYNTFATKILYKNEYEHSSWLALLEARLLIAKSLLTDHAITCTTIDDYELHRLQFLLEHVFGSENHLATVVIRNNPSGRSTVKGFSVNHEYGLFFARSSEDALVGYMPHTEKQRRRYDEVDEVGDYFEWENFRKSSAGSYRADRPRQFFPIFYDKQAELLRVPSLVWQDLTREWKVVESPSENETAIWPKDSAGNERVWRYGVERTRGVLEEAVVKEGGAGLEIYTRKYLQTAGILPRTWWDQAEYSARDNGTRALADLLGPGKLFDFPKAPAAVMDSLRAC
jgi:adenine-specific DNA-methyltransferase